MDSNKITLSHWRYGSISLSRYEQIFCPHICYKWEPLSDDAIEFFGYTEEQADAYDRDAKFCRGHVKCVGNISGMFERYRFDKSGNLSLVVRLWNREEKRFDGRESIKLMREHLPANPGSYHGLRVGDDGKDYWYIVFRTWQD